MNIKLCRDDIVYIKRLLHDIETVLGVIEGILSKKKVGISERYALRYAIIEVVESLALISLRIAKVVNYPLKGYIEPMRFFLE